MKTSCNTLFLSLILFVLISCEKQDPVPDPYPYSYLEEPGFIKDGLIGYYPFNGDTKDYSGSSNDAVASDPAFVADRHNYSFGAIHFNGIDNFLLIPGIGRSLTNNEGTIILWSRTGKPYVGYDHPKPVILSIVDSINACFLLSSRMGNLEYSLGMYPKLGGGSVMSSITKEDFELFVLTFTENGITKHSYRNGQYLQNSISNQRYSFGFNKDRNNQDFYLGKSIIDTFISDTFDNYFTFFKGAIDDLLIYDRVLTDEEIMFIFSLEGE